VVSHVPLVLQASNNKREAELLQQRLGTNIDLNPITDGTYIFGGKHLERETMMWQEQTKRWARDGAMDDLRALDVFAGYMRSEDRIPRILKRARASYLGLMLDTFTDPIDEQGNRRRASQYSDWDPGDFTPGDVITLDDRRGQIVSILEDDFVLVRWLDNDEEEEVYMPTFAPTGSVFTGTPTGVTGRSFASNMTQDVSQLEQPSGALRDEETVDALHSWSAEEHRQQTGVHPPGQVAYMSFDVEMQSRGDAVGGGAVGSAYSGRFSAASALRSITSIVQETEREGALRSRSSAGSSQGGVPLLGSEARTPVLRTSSRETQQSRRLEEGRPSVAESDSEQGDSGSEFEGGAWSDDDGDDTRAVSGPISFEQPLAQAQGNIPVIQQGPISGRQSPGPEFGQLGFRPRSPSPPPRMPEGSL